MITYKNLTENKFLKLRNLEKGNFFIHKIDFEEGVPLEVFMVINIYDHNIVSLKTGGFSNTSLDADVLPVDIEVQYKL